VDDWEWGDLHVLFGPDDLVHVFILDLLHTKVDERIFREEFRVGAILLV
jgi:hypothetical protein